MKRELNVNALLDDASTKTHISANVAVGLGLQNHPVTVNLKD